MSKTLLRAESANLPDMELARRVADGDDGAFERLMRRYNRTLFRTARGHDASALSDRAMS